VWRRPSERTEFEGGEITTAITVKAELLAPPVAALGRAGGRTETRDEPRHGGCRTGGNETHVQLLLGSGLLEDESLIFNG